MVQLILNAPKQMVNSEDKRSFEQTLASGVGNGYAIAYSLWLQCRPGCSVVLLSKDEGKRRGKAREFGSYGEGWKRHSALRRAYRRAAPGAVSA